MELSDLLNMGIHDILTVSLKAAVSNPREAVFLARFAQHAKDAEKCRAKLIAAGENIPPFLIASITGKCNFNCQGCYHRAQESLYKGTGNAELSAEDWVKIFYEARDCGVSFILLAGGEPLLRRDVLKQAAEVPEILFPVFTNGALLTEEYIHLFKKSRNLFPVLSLEGDEAFTDLRRGSGVYDSITRTMAWLKKQKIFYGASITVTKENILEVTDKDFVAGLSRLGCMTIIYVEYVPVMATRGMTPPDGLPHFLEYRIGLFRDAFPDMLFYQLPGR